MSDGANPQLFDAQEIIRQFGDAPSPYLVGQVMAQLGDQTFGLRLGDAIARAVLSVIGKNQNFVVKSDESLASLVVAVDLWVMLLKGMGFELLRTEAGKRLLEEHKSTAARISQAINQGCIYLQPYREFRPELPMIVGQGEFVRADITDLVNQLWRISQKAVASNTSEG